MSSWPPAAGMTSFDVESTGVDVEQDRIVTATVAIIRRDVVSDVRPAVINPGVPVPDAAAEVHGWTTERVQAEGKPPASELDWIAADLALSLSAGIPLVIANAPYDLTILDRELRRHRLPTLPDRLDGRPVAPVIDPMVIDKQIDRYRRGKKTLTALCETYGVTLGGAHDAAEDALAAARLVWRIGQMANLSHTQLAARYADRRHPHEVARAITNLAGFSVQELHDKQVGWYREQALSFADYLRKQARKLQLDQGPDDVQEQVAALMRRADGVTTDWPMRPWKGAEIE